MIYQFQYLKDERSKDLNLEMKKLDSAFLWFRHSQFYFMKQIIYSIYYQKRFFESSCLSNGEHSVV